MPGTTDARPNSAWPTSAPRWAEASADIPDLVNTRVLVATTRQADLVAAWEVIRDALAPHDPPSTLMGVTVLGYDDQLVELEAIAAVSA